MGRRQRNGSLGLDENVAVLGVQHTLADELLGDGDGDVVGHTQVREVVQEPGVVTAGVGRGLRGWSLVGMKPPPPAGSPSPLEPVTASASALAPKLGRWAQWIPSSPGRDKSWADHPRAGGGWLGAPGIRVKGAQGRGVIFRTFNNWFDTGTDFVTREASWGFCCTGHQPPGCKIGPHLRGVPGRGCRGQDLRHMALHRWRQWFFSILTTSARCLCTLGGPVGGGSGRSREVAGLTWVPGSSARG